MNRTGMIIVLAITVSIGVLFAIYPGLDIWIAGHFYDPQSKLFMLRWWISMWRDAGMWIIVALASPVVLAFVMRLIWRRRCLFLRGRAILFLLTTLALAPGLASNVILKNYWGRPRPIDIQQFGGDEHFVAWWDPRGDCPKNCSFVSGDVSGAFWTLAPAALVPPIWRALAYAAAIVFGASISLARMAFGGHFFTDVFFAGILTYLIVWTTHGLIYRWYSARITDKSTDQAIEVFTQHLYNIFWPRRSG